MRHSHPVHDGDALSDLPAKTADFLESFPYLEPLGRSAQPPRWHGTCNVDGMKQMSLGESGYERKTKRTRKREFLDEMNLVVPWACLLYTSDAADE